MKRLVMSIALTCVLSCSALAGDVPSVGFTPPPDQPPAASAPVLSEILTLGLTQEMSAALALVQLMVRSVV